MKFSNIFLFFFISIYINNLIYCEEKADFELLNYKEKKTFEINDTDPYIRLYMEVDSIKAKTIYLYVYIKDPTKVDFSYQFLNEGDISTFKDLDSYIVTNHGSEHTVYYKIEKPKENGVKLYMKIKARKYSKGQNISVESTESITDIYKIIAIIISIITIITTSILIIVFYVLYNTKRDKTIMETNEYVIIEKVRPEDFQPLR